VRRRLSRIAVSLLAAAAPCFAVEQTLDNGLRVVLIPHRANPMVASAVLVGAGVVDEPPEASGASHFLEHLLFNGTESRTQRQLYDDVDRIGAYNNATTREDHTLFTLLVAKEHAEDGLAIQADMLFRSTIPEENFEKERKIVLEELARDRSQPGYELEGGFRAFAFAGTPIARPVLGTEASLGSITRAQVVAYYKARYVPANMTLVVMGDFEPTEMTAAIKRTFGAVRGRPAPKSPAGRWPARSKENVEVVAGEGDSSRFLAAFPLGSAPWDKTTTAAELLLTAASDGADSPLARALAQRGVKAASTSLGIERRRSPWTTVLFDAELTGEVDPKAVLDAVSDAIRATRSGGDARGRLDAAVTGATAAAVIARDQIHYFAMLHSSEILGAPAGVVGEEAQRIASLSSADCDAGSAALNAGLSDLRARLAAKDAASRRLTWEPAAGLAASDSPASGLRAGMLGNGLRYVVRASGDSDVFALHLAFAPRAAGEPPGRDGITDLLHRMMARATIVHDAASLNDRLTRLGATVKVVDDPSVPFDDYYTTPEFSWLRLEVPAAQWREAVGLVAEMVRFPAFTAEALDAARGEMRERVARRDGSPRETAVSALDALLAPAHPLTRPVYGTEASLAAITLDDLRSYHDGWASGKRMIASVVGPAGVEDVVRALTADFGALPAGDPVAATGFPPVTDRGATAEAKLGKSQSYLAVGSVIEVPPEDRAALAIAVAMLSDRLAFDLRETKGLAYSIGASIRPWGGRMRFEVDMGTRAANLDEARLGILDGVRAFRSTAPSAADVARAKNVARGASLMRRMTRISLAYEAGIEALRGREPGDERRFVDSLRTVDAEAVGRAAQAYLDPDKLAISVAR
jgi:predicted Zn-dependent peptidase